jgi:AcrR family transcriptional regulator
MTANPSPSTRRIGAEDSATRAALLDAAQDLMLESGYAAVTSRRVAARAALKPQLVHYYFRTMDDLFLALFRRGAEQNLDRQARALASAQPLRALWEFSCDPAGTRLMMEFTALANHRTVIRDEIKAYADRFRDQQVEAMTELFERNGVDASEMPPVAVAVLAAGLSRVLVMEDVLGVDDGHPEVLAMVERFLAQVDGKPAT